MNNKYLAWWTMGCTGEWLEIQSRGVSLPYGKDEMWRKCSLPTSLSSDSVKPLLEGSVESVRVFLGNVAHGLWTCAGFRGCTVSPNQYSRGSYMGFYPQCNYRHFWIHHHLFLSSFLAVSVPLHSLFPSITDSIWVGFCSPGRVRLFTADWPFYSWTRGNHVSLKSCGKTIILYIGLAKNFTQVFQ